MTAEGRSPVRVLVIDDHAVVRRGLADLINDEPGFHVCGACAASAEALAMAGALAPDVAIVDLSLGVESGLDLIAALRAKHPRIRVLVLSALDELLFAERSFRAGAHGYVMKDQSAEELLAALSRVADGRRYVSEAVADRVVGALAGDGGGAGMSVIDRLSDRERHVFQLIGQGLGTREIAEQLSVSVKTVESHLAHMKEKLGLQSGRELLRLAVSWTVGLTAGTRPPDP